jgi:hypothetical protein
VLTDTLHTVPIVAPSAGLECVGDHVTVALVPWVEFLFGKTPTWALTMPLTLSWSWYQQCRPRPKHQIQRDEESRWVQHETSLEWTPDGSSGPAREEFMALHSHTQSRSYVRELLSCFFNGFSDNGRAHWTPPPLTLCTEK